MRRRRKSNIALLVIVSIFSLMLGYSALTSYVKIDGVVDVTKTTWDVHFENVQVTSGSVEANPAPTTNNTTTTSMRYTINFTKPGDFYEYTVDIVNKGTIDAEVSLVSNKIYKSDGKTEITLPNYLTNTVTYSDGTAVNQEDLLNHGETKKIKVRVEFKKDISASDLPSDGDTTVVFNFVGKYKQANAPDEETDTKSFKKGDYVKLGGENFYVLKEDENEKVLLLPRYSLIDMGSSSFPQWVQNIYNEGTYKTSFSSSVYWHDETWYNQSSYSRTGGTLDNYYDDYYLMNFERGEVVTQARSSYVYRNKNNEDTDNDIYSIINNYRDQLKDEIDSDSLDARLMSVYEAREAGCYYLGECESWIASVDYWLGSTDDYECDDCIYSFDYHNGEYYLGSSNNNDSKAVRPVVEIDATELSKKAEMIVNH